MLFISQVKKEVYFYRYVIIEWMNEFSLNWSVIYLYFNYKSRSRLVVVIIIIFRP